MSDAADATLSAGFEDYEKGKHRRYELLFKVNGAAFVIATLFTKTETKDIIQGVVSLQMLAIGMMAFTIIIGDRHLLFRLGHEAARQPLAQDGMEDWAVAHQAYATGLRPVPASGYGRPRSHGCFDRPWLAPGGPQSSLDSRSRHLELLMRAGLPAT